MKKIAILLLMSALLMPTALMAKKSKANDFRYEIECASNAAQGAYMVKVWTYSKNKKISTEVNKRNAVHGIIFKGFSGKNGCIGQRALAPNPGVELEFKDYFKLFFADNGEYQKYVTLVEGTHEIVKMGNEYKIGVIVTVQKDALRKALETAGVVKSLNSGF